MKKYYFLSLILFPFIVFAQTAITSSIIPDLSAYGEATNYAGEGEYEIFLSADNILDKPIIVVDGFDPGDTRNIAALYSSLSYTGTSGTQNLADLLRVEGFDVVLLNFPTYVRAVDGATVDGGADFMERNAMLLVELLDIINLAKTPNNPEQNVIIGPSMGGIIARYALNYMENEALDSDTRLYMSFDSPHHGANVPIGLQHQLNYLANNPLSPVAELEPLIEGFLKSPAARQLLIDHFEPHLSGDDAFTFDPLLTLPQPHPFRAIFETNINNLTTTGFPENIRNVAIINGSGIGSTYLAKDGVTPVTNGFSVINTTIPVDSGSSFGADYNWKFKVINTSATDIYMKIFVDNMTNTDGTNFQLCFANVCLNSISTGSGYPNTAALITPGETNVAGNSLWNQHPTGTLDAMSWTFRYQAFDAAGNEIGTPLSITYNYNINLSIEEANVTQVDIYPTNVKEELTITSNEVLNAEIFNILGAKV
ncbi:hypothetical protein [uncultured Winogradskyella sp.]|uniref:esterase/lipase family protein n=1 Tax=uncultured Winogradskyella sp. TaxID=395353 RepID=UPI0030DB0A7F|tara:strand:- start:27790 stop:29232 length:1443 start_codon:yes stop_codon:yes gene_type:complete